MEQPSIFKALNGVDIDPEVAIWTPATGRRFRVMGYHLSSSVAGNVILRDNTAGTIVAVIPLAAGGPGVYVNLGSRGLFSAAANNPLTATGPTNALLSGVIFGSEE